MTAEERAAEVFDTDASGTPEHDPDLEILERRVAAAITAAVAEEREACAMVADETFRTMYDRTLDCLCHHDVRELAAAIRARGQA